MYMYMYVVCMCTMHTYTYTHICDCIGSPSFASKNGVDFVGQMRARSQRNRRLRAFTILSGPSLGECLGQGRCLRHSEDGRWAPAGCLPHKDTARMCVPHVSGHAQSFERRIVEAQSPKSKNLSPFAPSRSQET